MSKFVNDPKQFVREVLEGLVPANPDTLTYAPAFNLVMRADKPQQDKVSIVQGSGSGHEPAHAMAPAGACWTPPARAASSRPRHDYVYETTKLMASPTGLLLLLNNYMGHRMACDMSKERAKSEGPAGQGLAVV